MEKEIERGFFSQLLNQTKGVENPQIEVYQRLVFHRYYEVIKNSFPLFIQKVQPILLENSIKAFMRVGGKTPFIWQVSNEYRKFVKNSSFFGKKSYLYELLYFDWVEINLAMREYKLKKYKQFDFKESYKLSKSAKVKRFDYDIINRDYNKKRENFVVIYYDFKSDEVIYREISELIFLLLKDLKKERNLKSILKELCKSNGIVYKEAKRVLSSALKELFNKRVFI